MPERNSWNWLKKRACASPQPTVIQSTSDLRKWVSQVGFPTVLKANGSSGGDGTRVVHTLEEANSAFCKLQAPPLLARAVKRALLDRDKTLVWPSLLRRRSVVNAQAFVAGREATSAVVCWKGAVLASLQFEVINKRAATGPATVLRLIDHPEMSCAAERIVRRLNLSGFHGFDFMLETQTGTCISYRDKPTNHAGWTPGARARPRPPGRFVCCLVRREHPTHFKGHRE